MPIWEFSLMLLRICRKLTNHSRLGAISVGNWVPDGTVMSKYSNMTLAVYSPFCKNAMTLKVPTHCICILVRVPSTVEFTNAPYKYLHNNAPRPMMIWHCKGQQAMTSYGMYILHEEWPCSSKMWAYCRVITEKIYLISNDSRSILMS